MDPSPQVNLIFSTDIRLAAIPTPFGVGTGPEMCTGATTTDAYHAWGINTPNFAVLPTSPGCAPNFARFTRSMSHEDVETISDPAGAGMGSIGEHELADNCENRSDAFVLFNGFSLSRYWSNFDNTCLPRLDLSFPETGDNWNIKSVSATLSNSNQNSSCFANVAGNPFSRLTGDRPSVTIVPRQGC